MSRRLVVALLLMAQAFVTGCTDGRACTLIGCLDSFSIRPTDPASLAPGAYEFQLVIDGRSITCSTGVPVTDAVDACENRGTGPLTVVLTPPDRIQDITVSGSPSTVAITIVRDGQVVVSKIFKPSYRESQPNGPDCPPICRNAEAVLELPS